MIGQHETAHPVAHGHVGTALGEGDLDTGRPPRDECRKSALADTQQTLVDIGRVDLALNDVQDGYIAALLSGHGGDHAILRLQ